MIAVGRRITSDGARFISRRQKRPRGARLWGIGIGWTFFGFMTFPYDDAIRASDEYVDMPGGISGPVLDRHDPADDEVA